MATTANDVLSRQPEEPTGLSSKAKYYSFFRLLLRLVQVALVVVLTIAAGLYFGTLYAKPLAAVAMDNASISYAFGTAALLSMIKESLTLLPKLWEYLRTGKGRSLYEFSSFVFLTSLTLAVAFFLGGLKKNQQVNQQHDPIVPIASSVLTDPIIFLQPGRQTTFMVPFSDEANGCNVQSKEFQQGLTWFPGTKEFIDQLTTGISHCSIPGKRVQIEIRGFASSTDFGSTKGVGQKCQNSDDLNVTIANGRAQKVRDEMADMLKKTPNAIDLTLKHWAKIEEMRKDVRFTDRDISENFDKLRGDLTRRADIVVTDAGDCEPR